MKRCPTCEANYPNRFSVCPQDGAKLIESSGWSDGMVIRGKYRILCKVGQGGMGAVYKASHVTFDELRALKVMNPDLLADELFVKRFKQEAIIARKLDHPNAVRVDDLDESEDGLPFMVMEYIEGQSLKNLIEESGPLPPARVCAIVKQVAAALDAAHHLGMVHRDVKPANIVLIQTPEGEQAKVLDFGIAKVRETRSGDSGMTLTGTGMVMGTPQYMSPEQALGKRGDELDGRSDLYSLGVVMYQMLSGELPFKADTTMKLLLAHINTPPRSLLEAKPDLKIPPRLARVVMNCLEKDPNNRPASGAVLIQEIAASEEVLGASAPAADSGDDMATMIASPRASRGASPESRSAVSMTAPTWSGGGSAAVAAATPPAIEQPVIAAAPAAPQPKHGRAWLLAAAIIIVIVAAGAGVWYFRFRPQPAQTVVQKQTVTAPPASKPAISEQQAATQPPLPSGTSTNAAASLPLGAESSTKPGSANGTASNTAPVERAVNTPAPATKRPSRLMTDSNAARLSQRHTKTNLIGTAPAVSHPAIASTKQFSAQPPANITEAVSSRAPAGMSNPNLGSAVITSSPGAQIYINGKNVGTVGSSGKLTVNNLAPGIYTLHATLKGFPDVDAGFRVGVGGIAFPHPIFDSSQTGQTTYVPAQSQATPAAAAGHAASAAAVDYQVEYLRHFGSSRGLLAIAGHTVRYQPSDGKDAFSAPVAGVSWRANGGHEFSLTANGKTYKFRSASTPQILASLQHASGAPSLESQ